MRTAILAYIVLALLASPAPAAAEGTPSAAPTTEIEGHTLPPLETKKPQRHEKPAAAHDEATENQRTGIIFAGAIFVLALLVGLIGWWLVSRREGR